MSWGGRSPAGLASVAELARRGLVLDQILCRVKRFQSSIDSVHKSTDRASRNKEKASIFTTPGLRQVNRARKADALSWLLVDHPQTELYVEHSQTVGIQG